MAQRDLTDTSRDSLELMDTLYARMTPEQKLRRVSELSLATTMLALAGLRRRHPDESEDDLRERLNRIRLSALPG